MEITLDSLFSGQIKLLQPKEGYRFSVDAPLLASWVKLKRGEKAIELGTGNGVIAVILAKKFKESEIVALEVQKELVALAKKNVELNGVSERTKVLQMDIRECQKYFQAQGFDVVVSNPPYFPKGHGRLNLHTQEVLARHEVLGTLEDFLRASSYLLKDGGRCYYIYPPERLLRLLSAMKAERLEPKRLRFVHPRLGEPSRMVLVEAIKGAKEGLKVEPPLFIFDQKGGYTEEMVPIIFQLEEGR